jgi:hypothetical protein
MPASLSPNLLIYGPAPFRYLRDAFTRDPTWLQQEELDSAPHPVVFLAFMKSLSAPLPKWQGTKGRVEIGKG